MATYLTLDEAAKKLGIPTQSLIDLRSQGQVRGFRDGSSWKFPDNEIDRLKEELPNLSGLGSGILGADGPGSQAGQVIGGDAGSDLDLDDLVVDDEGSDVNLVTGDGSGDSDVLVIPGGTGDSAIGSGPGSGSGTGSGRGSGMPIDLDDLEIAGSAISHDSGELNLAANEAKAAGDQPAAEQAPAAPAKSAEEAAEDSDEFNLGSVLDLDGGDDNAPALEIDSGAGEPGSKASPGSSGELSGLELAMGDSGDVLAGSDSDIDLGMVQNEEGNASSLEAMDDLDLSDNVGAGAGTPAGPASGDVLSELDLLGGDSVGSDLLSGDSDNLLGSSLVGKDEGGSSGVDDALADDDDLVISDDDDDLIVSSAGSDISIAGDSGINLMSPSDSGLSLESEPLDLAGSSSISALDLGAELTDGSGSGSGGSSGYGSGLVTEEGSGAGMDFPADEEFQLSPSGIQIEKSDESESQEIAVENSDSFDDAGLGEASFDEGGPEFGGFEDDPGFAADPDAGLDEPEAVEVAGEDDFEQSGYDSQSASAPVGAPSAYEIPFTVLQTVGLLLILVVMSLGGMLMTDLVRNMWAYTEPATPVSSLTDMLIDVAGWGK